MPTRPPLRPARVAVLGLLAALLAVALPASASAAPAPHWVLSSERSVPLEWFQGLTHRPAPGALGPRFFVGVFVGVTRTDASLTQQARSGDVLPAPVAAAGFNHIGDPSWLAAGGGRLLLPLECYTPGGPNGGNTCGRGAFGLLDPVTLQWRGLVRLDPRDIPKAMWAEVSPDGRLVWTSAGDDLLAYRVVDVLAAVDATGAIRPVRRLIGAVPPSGVTGATFRGRRLLLSGQAPGDGPLQVWSVDVDGTGAGTLEVQLPVVAESEGLDLVPSADGLLHWLLSPFASGPPTYGTGHSEVVSFVPRAAAGLRVWATRTAGGDVVARVTLALDGLRRPVGGATVSVGGASATTPPSGVVVLHLSPAVLAGRLVVTASKAALRPGRRVLPRR